MALFIPADLHQKLTGVQPANGTNFTLDELYHLLDCTCIELVETFTGDLMVIDGEGKGVKPKNVRATELVPFVRVGELKAMLAANPDLIVLDEDEWRDLPDDAKADYIVGDVIVCKQSDIR